MLKQMLKRIDYHEPVGKDVATLKALHRAWRLAVPYENLDIQLGRPIRLDQQSLYDKLIIQRRGGYCYEQNGGLAMLLRAAGFDVAMVEAAVMRADRGDSTWGNHNALLVDVQGQRWLADAGIGDGFVEPLPLQEATYRQQGQAYRLQELEPDTWRMHHHQGGSIPSYDFHLAPKELSDFGRRCEQLSTAPDSPYVTTLIVGRTEPVGTTSLLLSRTIRTIGMASNEPASRRLTTHEEFVAALRDDFLIPVDDLGPAALEHLWARPGSPGRTTVSRAEGHGSAVTTRRSPPRGRSRAAPPWSPCRTRWSGSRRGARGPWAA